MHPLARRLLMALLGAMGAVASCPIYAADFNMLERQYIERIQPLLREMCWQCHATQKREGELDLERFANLAEIRADAAVWLKVIEMFESREMPPQEAPQLSDQQRGELKTWLDAYVAAEAAATAGDPGPVVLRRLNNVETTNTIQELTGLPLEPTREFPADSAAGEGFTNTGNSLVMSPALLDKYMAAAKSVAEHAVLLPDGIGFSPHTTRRDWTDDVLRRLREFYGRFTDPSGSTRVNLQGLQWDTNAGGRLPLAPYLQALVESRSDLLAGKSTPEEIADSRQLNGKYMRTLWDALSANDASALIRRFQARLATVDSSRVSAMVDEIRGWQEALTRFQSVGHMKPWLSPIEPLVERHDVRLKLEPVAGQSVLTIDLAAGDAGDGNADDLVTWLKPRLVAPGRRDIPLRDVGAILAALDEHREELLAGTAKCLQAAAFALDDETHGGPTAIAQRLEVDPALLGIWFDYLSITASGPVKLEQLFTDQIRSAGGYDFVSGWGSAATPSIMASSGDEHVRIPGNMKPHGVVVHPSPTLNAVVSWRSPINGVVRVDGTVTHAHPECGNGVSWAVERRRGAARERLVTGGARGGSPVTFGPLDPLHVRQGELISLLIGPQGANHSCDLTDIEFRLSEISADQSIDARVWNLTADVSPDILAGNPHADHYGHADTWNFYAEPVTAADQNRAVIPNGSLLRRWLDATDASPRSALVEQIHTLLNGPRPDADGPDRQLWDQTHDLNGPLLGPLVDYLASRARDGTLTGDAHSILSDGHQFGKSVDGGSQIDVASLAVQAPSVVRVRLPSELCRGRELLVTGALDSRAGGEGCVQLQVSVPADADARAEPPALTAALPIVVQAGGTARDRFVKAASDFRQIFPAALCYTKIVPVDEVVTLALFHREDENMQRLMLSADEIAQLDRLWNELHFVSNDLIVVEDAFEQLMQFATQDSDPKLFEHLREPIQQRAAAFRAALLAAEPRHLEAVLDFAARAFRRPLSESEQKGLRGLYDRLRREGLDHEAATRLLLVRVLMSTSLLYRLERSQPGTASSPVSDWELASRLSYFLWSGPPDEQLRTAAAVGELRDVDKVAAQARRMLGDQRTRYLAREFACQWLQVQDVRELDEKSERHFPEFAELKGDLQTEVELFFTDLFQNDRSMLEIFEADHTFLNERLAKHYGIDGVAGDKWRRVDGVRKVGRGGVLMFGASLAKQSGASRTSPILRGTWISEVLLGEKLPKPPKDVPVLPVDESSEILTVRQLVERHTQDERCASCHARIDPFGFALESYDAIGRLRTKDLAGHALDTRVNLPDGSPVDNADQLRSYLVNRKRDALVKQFCRKLLGYALGRAVQLSDQPLIADMQRSLAENDYRVGSAIEPIVRSRQFLHIRDQQVAAE